MTTTIAPPQTVAPAPVIDAAQLRELLDNPPADVCYVVADITPAMAEMLFARRGANPRRYNRKNGERYAKMMATGDWRFTGEGPILNLDGGLIQGQTRMAGIIGAGKLIEPGFDTFSVRMGLIFGVEDKAATYMDTGNKRSLAQALTQRGEEHSTQLGGALRMIYQIEENTADPQRWVSEPSYSAMADRVTDDIRQATRVGQAIGQLLVVPPSAVAAAYWACRQDDADVAGEFFDQLHTGRDEHGADLTDTSIPKILRDRLIGMRTRGSVSRVEQIVLYDGIVRSYILFRDGSARSRLKFATVKNPPKAWLRP